MKATRHTLVPAMLYVCVGLAHAAGQPDPDMQKVLDALASLNGKPIETLTPQEARKQPTPADAVKKVLADMGKDTTPDSTVTVKDISIPGKGGSIPAHVYTPSGSGPFPVTVYFHGGGFVIADTKTYDASVRALAKGAASVVVSVDYRQAPEHKFPAAPEDAYAAYTWAIKHAGDFNGVTGKAAVAGESAGGNLATVVSMMARDKGGTLPTYELLVYPVADADMTTPSYQENADAKPLNKAMMAWFFKYYGGDPTNPYALPMKAKSLKGLPPATVITAEIDPLRSEGQAYAKRLKADGVTVTEHDYSGVTHEFFGMGAVVKKAQEAEDNAAAELKASFK